jgi:hypothetical protein
MSNEEKSQVPEESQEEVCAEYQSFMPNIAPEEVEPVKSEPTIN